MMLLVVQIPAGAAEATMQSMKAEPSSVTLNIGKSQILQVKAAHDNGKTKYVNRRLPQYSSSDTSIVTINNYGQCRGINKGTATITVNMKVIPSMCL